MRALSAGVVAALVGCGSGRTGSPALVWQLAPTATGPSAELSYDVIDLGAARVFSIDPKGRVTGNAWSGTGTPSGSSSSLWTAGVYTPGSGWTSVPVPEGASFAWPMGIDEGGRVALNVWFPYPFPRPAKANPDFERAYAGSPALPVLAPGESATSLATSMVNAVDPSTGHVVGFDELLGGGFLYDGSTMTPIAVQPLAPGQGALAGASSVATALNSRDQVVGSMWIPQYGLGQGHAFFWDHGALVDLGAIGPCASEATGINAAGLVVGRIELGTYCGGLPRLPLDAVFLWHGRDTRIVGCPRDAAACIPAAINVRGDVVGDALVDSVGERAFILRDGTFHWLDENVGGARGWRFETPVGINDAGEIVGQGTLNGEFRAFLLVPR